jgi:hypothetical protein
MKADDSKLDFAYKYPFSQEAREVVADLKLGSVDAQYLKEGFARLEGAFKDGKVPHERLRGVGELKQKRILGYVYARMLVSALGDAYAISRFAAAEANASGDFLPFETEDTLMKISKELGLEISKDAGYFAMSFEKFVSIPKKEEMLKLVNQRLANGIIRMDNLQMHRLLRYAIEKEITSRLPIEKKSLPKEIIEAAKGLKPQEQKIELDIKAGAYSWIEKLMLSPIADVRHRTVNLILAPYLTNVKKLDEETASRLIMEYIDRCKKVNPDTKVNETYIRYQVKYAKTKGLRPMSLTRAKDLLRGVADFG